jgi:hypothetical protein
LRSRRTVSLILTNKTYAGFAQIGGAGGKRLRKKDALHRVGAMEKEGCCPAIVTLEDWEAVQEIIVRRREDGTKPRGESKISPLSGILVCGHCGAKLQKKQKTERNGRTYRIFQCTSSEKKPGATPCGQWRVYEDEILPLAIDVLVKEMDGLVTEPLTPGSQHDPLPGLKARLEELQKDIRRGQERYLRAPESLLAALEKTLLEWQEEASQVERQIDNMTRSEGVLTDFAKWWQEVRGNLVSGKLVTIKSTQLVQGDQVVAAVPTVVCEADRLRSLLKKLGVKVTIFWKPKKPGGHYHVVDTARIEAQIGAHSNARTPG